MTQQVWKLNKTIYGLNDASRSWYLKLRDELLSLGAVPVQLDQGIFVWYHNKDLLGIIVSFIDDLLWRGAQKFLKTIESLLERFDIRPENATHLAYICINLSQRNDFSININQNEYKANLHQIALDNIDISDKHRTLTVPEKTCLRKALGQLNWLAGITQPEISFTVSELSSRVNSATISDLLSVNKAIKFVQTNEST